MQGRFFGGQNDSADGSVRKLEKRQAVGVGYRYGDYICTTTHSTNHVVTDADFKHMSLSDERYEDLRKWARLPGNDCRITYVGGPYAGRTGWRNDAPSELRTAGVEPEVRYTRRGPLLTDFPSRGPRWAHYAPEDMTDEEYLSELDRQTRDNPERGDSLE